MKLRITLSNLVAPESESKRVHTTAFVSYKVVAVHVSIMFHFVRYIDQVDAHTAACRVMSGACTRNISDFRDSVYVHADTIRYGT